MNLNELYKNRLALETKLNDLKHSLRKYSVSKQGMEDAISSSDDNLKKEIKILDRSMQDDLSKVSKSMICAFHNISSFSYYFKSGVRKNLMKKDVTNKIESDYSQKKIEVTKLYSDAINKTKPNIDSLLEKLEILSKQLSQIKEEIIVSDSKIALKVNEIEVMLAENKFVLPDELEIYHSYKTTVLSEQGNNEFMRHLNVNYGKN